MVLIAGGIGSNGSSFYSLNAAEVVDPATVTFTPTGYLNNARDQHTATLLSNGMVLIVGGERSSGSSSTLLATAELYDPATGTFTSAGSMDTARYQHTTTLLNNGMVLIAGGSNANINFASAELYDPEIGRAHV